MKKSLIPDYLASARTWMTRMMNCFGRMATSSVTPWQVRLRAGSILLLGLMLSACTGPTSRPSDAFDPTIASFSGLERAIVEAAASGEPQRMTGLWNMSEVQTKLAEAGSAVRASEYLSKVLLERFLKMFMKDSSQWIPVSGQNLGTRGAMIFRVINEDDMIYLRIDVALHPHGWMIENLHNLILDVSVFDALHYAKRMEQDRKDEALAGVYQRFVQSAQEGHIVDALANYDELSERWRLLHLEPVRLDMLLLMLQEEIGKPSTAALTRAALDYYPDTGSDYLRGQLELDQGNMDRAYAALSRFNKTLGGDAVLESSLSYVSLMQNKPDLALQHAWFSVKRAPYLPSGFLALSRVLSQQQDYEGAVMALSAAQERADGELVKAINWTDASWYQLPQSPQFQEWRRQQASH